MPASFHFPDRADFWLPLQMDPAKATRTDYFLRRRCPPQTRRLYRTFQLSGDTESLLEQIHRENPAANNNWIAHAIPIRDFVAWLLSQSRYHALGSRRLTASHRLCQRLQPPSRSKLPRARSRNRPAHRAGSHAPPPSTASAHHREPPSRPRRWSAWRSPRLRRNPSSAFPHPCQPSALDEFFP